jgi:hypothetical protein
VKFETDPSIPREIGVSVADIDRLRSAHVIE